MGKYSKFYVALAAALVAGANQLWGVNSAYATLLVGVLGALGVYGVANRE
jgi:hypothetical protein